MNSTTLSLREMDQAHHIDPFTLNADMHLNGGYIMQSAEGNHISDDKGNRLLDGLAGLWCVNVGYNRKEIIDAITQQLNKLCYCPSFINSTTEPTILLSKKLCDLGLPRLTHTLYATSGSGANETAIKIILKEGPGTIAALFAEPIQGAGGAITPPTGYMKDLRELARKYNILYVSDEVVTGFGRVGCMYLSDEWDLDPDREVRCDQLIGALELLDNGNKVTDPACALGPQAAALIRKNGVIVRTLANLIAISPCLITDEEGLDELFVGVRKGLDALVKR